MAEEITAEYSVEALSPNVPLRVRPKVSVACKTDLGRVRENNEDKLEYFIPEDEPMLAARGLVFVVCDGMGGHEAGQIASELATKTFIDQYLRHPSEDALVAARSAVQSANRFVFDVARSVPNRRGMGTTLSALAIVQDQACVVQVGDSRVYRLRGGSFDRLTTDHTWVEEVIAAGMLSREEAETHANRHVLTRAIGTGADVNADVTQHSVEEGDVYVLCSDGLLNHAEDEEIREAFATKGLSDAVWDLVALALSRGGSDNCTILGVRVDALERV